MKRSLLFLLAVITGLGVILWARAPSVVSAKMSVSHEEPPTDGLVVREKAGSNSRQDADQPEPLTDDARGTLIERAAHYPGVWDAGLRSEIRRLPPLELFEFLLTPEIAARDEGWDWLKTLDSACWMFYTPEIQAASVEAWCAPLREKYSDNDVTFLIADRRPAQKAKQTLPGILSRRELASASAEQVDSYFDSLDEYVASDDPDLAQAAVSRLWEHGASSASPSWDRIQHLDPQRAALIGLLASTRVACAIDGDCGPISRFTLFICAYGQLHLLCPLNAPMDEIFRLNLTPIEFELLNESVAQLLRRRSSGG